jgi:hypothetical protein
MTIWIVEDRDDHAAKALKVIEEVARRRQVPVEVFRDSTILWKSGLSAMKPQGAQMVYAKGDRPPTIIILDLFDEADVFRAASYLGQLRVWEIRNRLPAAWVIVWSVNTGLPEVQEFLVKAPARDRRVVFTASKQEAPLRDSLERCLQSWKEVSLP